MMEVVWNHQLQQQQLEQILDVIQVVMFTMMVATPAVVVMLDLPSVL